MYEVLGPHGDMLYVDGGKNPCGGTGDAIVGGGLATMMVVGGVGAGAEYVIGGGGI